MSKILCTGNMVLDIVHQLARFPEEDEEMRAENVYRRIGGNAANSAAMLATRGHKLEFCGSVASDIEGDWLIHSLGQASVGCRYCQRQDGVSPVSQILLNSQNGSRTIVHYRDLPELEASHLTAAPLETFDWFHFEGRNLTELEKMLEHCDRIRVDQGISLEIEKNRDNIETLLHFPDVVFFSREYAQAKGFASAPDFLQHMGEIYDTPVMTCTWGDQGAWLLTQQRNLHHQPPRENLRITNTVGAGDAFNAGFIHAMNSRMSAVDALKTATEFAEEKIIATDAL